MDITIKQTNGRNAIVSNDDFLLAVAKYMKSQSPDREVTVFVSDIPIIAIIPIRNNLEKAEL